MVGKTTNFANDLLELFFNGSAFPNLADNAAVSPATNLYLSLHTADPGAAGNQTSSETTYGGYTRMAVARTTGGWVITTNQAKLNAQVDFPVMTSGSNQTITHWGIGLSASGTGYLMYSGTLSPNVPMSNGVQPQIRNISVVTES